MSTWCLSIVFSRGVDTGFLRSLVYAILVNLIAMQNRYCRGFRPGSYIYRICGPVDLGAAIGDPEADNHLGGR